MCQIHDPPSIIKGTPSIDTKKCVNREQHQEQGAITHRIWRSGLDISLVLLALHISCRISLSKMYWILFQFPNW